MNKSICNGLARVLAYEEQRPAITNSGVLALNRLIPLALRRDCQGGVVGHFLLGLYNGDDFLFGLTDLRSLDRAVFQDCIRVLLMDYSPEVEVHERVPNGGAIWQNLMEMWAPEVVGE